MKIVLDNGAYMPEYAHNTDAGADLRSPASTVRGQEWYNMECPICGKKFHLKPSAAKRFKTHCCSMECCKKMKSKKMSGVGNHQYGLRGRKNASWKSDTRISSCGYILIRSEEHPFRSKDGFVFEHRIIAEKSLLNESNSVYVDGKMYLNPELEVHHINFDRKDNRPDNLIVLTHKEHKKIHNALNPNKRRKDGKFQKEIGIVVKVKRVSETAKIPEKKSIGAAAYDLCADISEPVTIKPHETVMIKSGLAFDIPKGFFGAIYARSGISTRLGLRPATCVSIIDSDYRGEVGLPMHNDTDEEKTIEANERICQIIFERCYHAEFEQVDTLEETERGNGGFGSTGR